MAQSPVVAVDSSDGYDRSVWKTSNKPHPTRSDFVAFEEECISRKSSAHEVGVEK